MGALGGWGAAGAAAAAEGGASAVGAGAAEADGAVATGMPLDTEAALEGAGFG